MNQCHPFPHSSSIELKNNHTVYIATKTQKDKQKFKPVGQKYWSRETEDQLFEAIFHWTRRPNSHQSTVFGDSSQLLQISGLVSPFRSSLKTRSKKNKPSPINKHRLQISDPIQLSGLNQSLQQSQLAKIRWLP